MRRLAFETPTPVQSLALAPAMSGEDMVLLAPTGTGKTLVYLLPLWQLLLKKNQTKALVLVPTRELAYQVSQMLQQLEQTLREHIILLVGGHDIDSQRKALQGRWRLIIATPGRLCDHLQDKPDLLRPTRLAVLDEFDRLVDLGFEAEVGRILHALPSHPQRLLLSATPQDESMARLGLQEIPVLTVDREGENHPLKEFFYLLKGNKTKGKILLEYLAALNPREQALIFVNNIAKSHHLHGLLKLRGFQAGFLHGHQIQSQRADTFQKFRQGTLPILVATDLAARGFDIPEVSLIVNYDLPKNMKQYIHRSGRTARRGRDGLCISFAGPEDWLSMRNLKEARPEGMPYHPGYAQEEPWFRQAKKVHDIQIRREEKSERIRTEQGLS